MKVSSFIVLSFHGMLFCTGAICLKKKKSRKGGLAAAPSLLSKRPNEINTSDEI